MACCVKNYLGYQIPQMFSDEEIAYSYLKTCGVKNPNKSIGKLYYWLNELRVTSHLKKNRYRNEDGWTIINTAIVKKIFGDLKFFYAINNNLIKDGLVEVFCNNDGKPSYLVGKFYKKYRLTDLINEDEWKVMKVDIAKCTTTKKVLEYYKSKWKPIDRKLYDLLTQIKIDELDFFNKTNINNFQNYPSEILDVIINKASEKSALNYDRPLKDIYCFYKDSYNSVREEGWRYSVDKNGRRHTNITNLPKILRKHLYIIDNGQKKRFMTVDVVNCQVLLLLTILPPSLSSYQKFKSWVESGLFYEKFSAAIGIELTTDNRTIIKQQFFTFMYGDNKEFYVCGSKAYKMMVKEFPDIVTYLNNYKNKYGYEIPANKMQQAESDIIINNVCKTLVKASIKFTQVYDSIICLEQDIDVVKNSMIQSFSNKNLNVKLKIETAC